MRQRKVERDRRTHRQANDRRARNLQFVEERQ